MDQKMKHMLATTLIGISLGLSLTASYASSESVLKSPELKGKIIRIEKRLPFNAEELISKFSSWGVAPSNDKSSINLLPAWEKFEKQKEIVVAVIDTGIDPEHSFLKNNIYIPEGSASINNYGVDFSKGSSASSTPIDNHGHGTHVSGIIRSVFPEVKILALKYYNPQASGQANLESTIRALQYAVDLGVDIINYSGGGPEPAEEELKILKAAEAKGILVVAAAGNEESDIDIKTNAYYPASYKLSNIITVGAYNQDLTMLKSSNFGSKSVDLVAPGFRIRSAYPKERAGYLTGTSQATAFVTGVAALVKAKYPQISAAEMKKIIVGSAKKEITFLNKCISGGRLDADRALGAAQEKIEAPTPKPAPAQKRDLATAKLRVRAPKKGGKITYRFKR